MRCARKFDPQIDRNVIEVAHAEGQHLTSFEVDLIADENDIGDADPRSILEHTTRTPPS